MKNRRYRSRYIKYPYLNGGKRFYCISGEWSGATKIEREIAKALCTKANFIDRFFDSTMGFDDLLCIVKDEMFFEVKKEKGRRNLKKQWKRIATLGDDGFLYLLNLGLENLKQYEDAKECLVVRWMC